MIHYTTAPLSDKMIPVEHDDLIERICGGYCSFYKPGKKEDLACKGFLVLQRLLEKRQEVNTAFGEVRMGREAEDDLFHALCPCCPFFADDCDFAAWKRGGAPDEQRESVNPCGGFLILGYYLGKGILDIQAINQVI